MGKAGSDRGPCGPLFFFKVCGVFQLCRVCLARFGPVAHSVGVQGAVCRRAKPYFFTAAAAAIYTMLPDCFNWGHGVSLQLVYRSRGRFAQRSPVFLGAVRAMYARGRSDRVPLRAADRGKILALEATRGE